MARKAATGSKLNKLSKLLDKRGIKDLNELAPEEKATYDRFRYILTGEALTVDTIKQFCESQLSLINSKADGINPLTMLQQACIHVYGNILKAIELPEMERRNIERHLDSLINE